MADIVNSQTRSRMMSAVRSTNTKPELILRSALHKAGFRFRLHDKRLAGKPDLVFPVYQAVIFVNGCFWHRHDCHLFKWPQTREAFWKDKILSNVARDARNYETLLAQDWKIAIIWECAFKGKTKKPLDQITDQCATWLKNEEKQLDIMGNE